MTAVNPQNFESSGPSLAAYLRGIDEQIGCAPTLEINLANVNHSVNQNGKRAGKKVRVSDRTNVIVVAQGPLPTDPWLGTDTLFEVTPL